MRTNRTFGRFLLTLGLVPLLALTGCSRAASQTLTVTGSTTILPIAEVSAEDFDAAHPGVRILVSGVGSSAGIESVTKGSCDIGTSSRDLQPGELSLGLVDTPIAYDVIAVVVNPSNPVRSLTKAQVRDIFEGKITNWRALGGPDMPIGLVNRDEASGTRDAFSKAVLGGAPFSTNAAVLPGTGQVRAVVAGTSGAIGYISFGFVTPDVRALAIDGVRPSPATAVSGTYPLRRLLHFLTKGPPTGLAKEYTDYVLSESVQRTVVTDAGFISIHTKAAP